MTLLVVRTVGESTPFGDENKADLECAVIDVDRLLDTLVSRASIIEHAQSVDNELYEICFWGQFAEYYPHDLVSYLASKYEDFDSAFYDAGFFVLPETDILDKIGTAQAECHQMIVRRTTYSNGIPLVEAVLSTMPKHVNVTVYTFALSLADLNECAVSAQLSA